MPRGDGAGKAQGRPAAWAPGPREQAAPQSEGGCDENGERRRALERS